MKAALISLEILLVAAAVLVYVAAKVDFFTAYHNDIPAYLHEHWPFWAALAAIALALAAIEAIRLQIKPPEKAIGDEEK
jgi:hypothetical protein